MKYLILTFSILVIFTTYDVYANPNLSVSAENPLFENHFAGSMVVEVIIRDSNIRDTDEGKGEPDVTLNGNTLRMAQGSDGNWYAYFANVNSAKSADSTVNSAGNGLDFGVFCGRDTPPSVFGIDLSETDGFSVPSHSGISGFSNGNQSFSPCQGVLENFDNYNNVVRKAKSLNTNSNVPSGQIGLEPKAWPLIQLFSFSDVVIRYNSGTGSQEVKLEYDDIPNISLNIDRDVYPQNAEVFLTITDIQLNQDPTDEDLWIFETGTSNAVFYDSQDADLFPHLSNLGFDDNGYLSIDSSNVISFNSNLEQPAPNNSQTVTLVENMPNSGIFDTGDYADKSVLTIKSDAPRGHAASISYNKDSISVLTGNSSANISLNKPSLTISDSLVPGTKFTVTLTDEDQNLNSDARDNLDVYNPNAIIPTLKIGNPFTLENVREIRFHDSDTLANSSIDDSSRLFIDTTDIEGTFEGFSLNLGDSSNLHSVLVPSHNSIGSNWLNYDFRSIKENLKADFGDTRIELFFDSLDSDSIILAEITSPQGFIQLDDETIREISTRTGEIFVLVNLDKSNDDSSVGVFTDISTHPIILDFFSFGLDDTTINNSIYRFELEETTSNSAIFEGTIEYAILNYPNAEFIKSIKTINDEIKFILLDRLVDGISISYSDINSVGITTDTSSKSDIQTHSGVISLDSDTYRFGQPATLRLQDPDLNLNNDLVEIYNVIDDPSSPNVDTVGGNGGILLEVLIKDLRYKRCIVDGLEHGGLGATGFSLVETSANSGVFEGIFKMPSEICNKSGTQLISTAGGSISAKYYDYRDDSGNQNIIPLSKGTSTLSLHLSMDVIPIPLPGTTSDVILSGDLTDYKRGTPLIMILVHPDGTEQEFATSMSSGRYGFSFTITEDSMPGVYDIILLHDEQNIGTTSFTVLDYEIPLWIKDAARNWYDLNTFEFVDGIRHLISIGMLESRYEGETLPDWVKNTVKWWLDGEISDDEFLNSIQFLLKEGIIRV